MKCISSQADVLIALAIASNYKTPLGRLQLQKFIYLGDVLNVIWEVVGSRSEFQTYKHGPYNAQIQNAVDTLTFRGFIDIVELSEGGGNIRASYSISDAGISVFQTLLEGQLFGRKIEVFFEIGRHIDGIGWSKLKELVYNEPTYRIDKTSRYGKSLKLTSLEHNLSLKILFQLDRMKEGEIWKFGKKNLTTLFFKLIE